MHPMLNVAVRAARQAGRLINRASLDVETMQVTRKERNDFVTEVDKAAKKPSSTHCCRPIHRMRF